ncbi:MAG TPA: helix-turn-helix transcriptional regulator [Actinokineospora sp.]|nr:helix-turn-helix transcriptional regulator [Actinokineospora sp.]
MRIDATTYQRVLGDEIRRLRKQRGWTRKELNSRLQTEISLQTLATYELGTRQCSVVRFVEICLALEEHPHDLLARVHDRVFAGTAAGRIKVDLRAVVGHQSSDLLPLRRWAAERLAEHTGPAPAEVHLDITAIERMAELCGLDTMALVGKLTALRNPQPG